MCRPKSSSVETSIAGSEPGYCLGTCLTVTSIISHSPHGATYLRYYKRIEGRRHPPPILHSALRQRRVEMTPCALLGFGELLYNP